MQQDRELTEPMNCVQLIIYTKQPIFESRTFYTYNDSACNNPHFHCRHVDIRIVSQLKTPHCTPDDPLHVVAEKIARSMSRK